MAPPPNLHATALVFGDRGILVAGGSGAGKTRLALALLDAARAAGVFGRLIADDQVFCAVRAGRLVVSTPPPLAGLVEVRGFGPVSIPTELRAVIDLAVRLVPPADAVRYREPTIQQWAGVTLPTLEFAAGDTANAVRGVMGWLHAAPAA